MTQKELIGKLANKLQWDESNSSDFLETISNILNEQLSENNIISIDNFGTFSTQKYQEYILVDSETGERYLMPPEVVVLFEPYTGDVFEPVDHSFNISFEADDSLKGKINSAFQNFEPTLINEGVEFPGIQVVSSQQPKTEIAIPVEPIADAEPTPPVETKVVGDKENLSKPVLQTDIDLRQKSSSRKSSRVLIPVLGGVAIVMATLFFFNGVASRKGVNSGKRRNN
jgi:nucleoid DNA-binding protein